MKYIQQFNLTGMVPLLLQPVKTACELGHFLPCVLRRVRVIRSRLCRLPLPSKFRQPYCTTRRLIHHFEQKHIFNLHGLGSPKTLRDQARGNPLPKSIARAADCRLRADLFFSNANRQPRLESERERETDMSGTQFIH